MTKLARCRLLLDEAPGSGSWNMAVDAVLLETAVTEGLATFRWYRWAEPTLSLGYFQKPEDVEALLPDLPRVRRMTGGGAILHDQEWTYSFAVPAEQRFYGHPEELYDRVHDAVIEVINGLGYALKRRGATGKAVPEPVLCFSRRDAHDVLLGEHKVLGSAQRRRKGAILQHGSLLWRASRLTPEHRGLEDAQPGIPVTRESLRQIPPLLAEAVEIERLAAKEVARAVEIAGKTPEESDPAQK